MSVDLTRLREALRLAPGTDWQGAICTYGLVVDVLQAAEQALRAAGLHDDADELCALMREFLAERRRREAELGVPVNGSSTLRRDTLPSELPSRQGRMSPGMRLPGQGRLPRPEPWNRSEA